ncbi:hypothetical protein V5F34_19695 [Xanthobacter autotrophicus]|jgi:hypothetical protein|uniref:Fimbrial protein n=1 Tax=Xanthobacter autotrophicus TaxID=280 RepID=A0A6C1KA58_XANAU|nr:hypothetical protein [Xanthobacter autotrophicus]TLX41020.1 hypothetical protein FBQ73_21525 [Xanthobacter autotrophicus]
MFHRPSPTETPEEALTPEQERIIQRFRRFSSLSMLVMVLGVAAVFGVIGYRMIRAKPIATGEMTALLPKGAKITATAVSGDVVVLTLDVGGAVEIRTFDARTLAPAGRLRFAEEP